MVCLPYRFKQKGEQKLINNAASFIWNSSNDAVLCQNIDILVHMNKQLEGKKVVINKVKLKVKILYLPNQFSDLWFVLTWWDSYLHWWARALKWEFPTRPGLQCNNGHKPGCCGSINSHILHVPLSLCGEMLWQWNNFTSRLLQNLTFQT